MLCSLLENDYTIEKNNLVIHIGFNADIFGLKMTFTKGTWEFGFVACLPWATN